MSQTETPEAKAPATANGWHLFLLSAFAVAQPIYSLLSASPEFFVANRADLRDIIVLALLISFAVPLVLYALYKLAGLGGSKLQQGVFNGLFVLLLTVTAMPLMNNISGLPGLGSVFLSGLLAIVGLTLYLKNNGVRAFFNFAAPVPCIVAVLFVVMLPSVEEGHTLAKAGEKPALTQSETPVVMVIFDELPITALMDQGGEIDHVRYPAFAEIASHASWYRNVYTVADFTLNAVPAILSGQAPEKNRLPNFNGYPVNLFTLLENSHTIHAVEPRTHLCPDRLCPVRRMFKERLGQQYFLLLDVGMIYLHIILKEDLTKGLPPVTTDWGGFVDDEQKEFQKGLDNQRGKPGFKDRVRLFEKFMSDIQRPGAADSKPALHFIHMVFPHGPYTYLPSGKKYDDRQIREEEVGQHREEAAVRQISAERYTLQLVYTDHLLGQLIQRLKAEGLYDTALIIVTADHGASFTEGESHRILENGNAADILPVPLFIKHPGQNKAEQINKNLRTIDILPTIIETLGGIAPNQQSISETGGHSALDKKWPGRTEARAVDKGWKMFSFPMNGELMRKGLAHKLQILGEGPVSNIFKTGELKELQGRKAIDYQPTEAANTKFTLRNADNFNAVDLQSSQMPALIEGRLQGADKSTSGHIAVAVNGVIGATRALLLPNGNVTDFYAIVPEEIFHEGKNTIELFWVTRNGDALKLEKIPQH